jgi:hypothetical protein
MSLTICVDLSTWNQKPGMPYNNFSVLEIQIMHWTFARIIFDRCILFNSLNRIFLFVCKLLSKCYLQLFRLEVVYQGDIAFIVIWLVASSDNSTALKYIVQFTTINISVFGVFLKIKYWNKPSLPSHGIMKQIEPSIRGPLNEIVPRPPNLITGAF